MLWPLKDPMVKTFLASIAAILLIAGLVVSTHTALADDVTRVTGGGTATFNADLDGDGEIDGSQFGLGVRILGNSSANGHFQCLMAGRSDILGLPLMAVEGKVTTGNVNSDGTATFGGLARVNLGDGTIFSDVPITVTASAGGPGVGTLTLTVIGAFDGVPGDTIIGNGNYDLPIETVSSGHVKVN
ncbi:MAG TPA: hypothetical protein VFR55_12280 [Dehalococcoidia bacterium]|nr:hypothetical protein [Dehalococcoidia bacterium]